MMQKQLQWICIASFSPFELIKKRTSVQYVKFCLGKGLDVNIIYPRMKINSGYLQEVQVCLAYAADALLQTRRMDVLKVHIVSHPLNSDHQFVRQKSLK
jgi:hypothetical protein